MTTTQPGEPDKIFFKITSAVDSDGSHTDTRTLEEARHDLLRLADVLDDLPVGQWVLIQRWS